MDILSNIKAKLSEMTVFQSDTSSNFVRFSTESVGP